MSGINPRFRRLSQSQGQVAHVLLTRSPLGTPLPYGRRALARLACITHAASVNPEPGSNSPSKRRGPKAFALSHLRLYLSLSHSSVVKVLRSPASLPPCGWWDLVPSLPDGRTKPSCRRRVRDCTFPTAPAATRLVWHGNDSVQDWEGAKTSVAHSWPGPG